MGMEVGAVDGVGARILEEESGGDNLGIYFTSDLLYIESDSR